MLLLGIDTTESGDLAGGRSDTIVLISGDPETGEGSMTSIPRDSLVNIPGHGEDKINMPMLLDEQNFQSKRSKIF